MAVFILLIMRCSMLKNRAGKFRFWRNELRGAPLALPFLAAHGGANASLISERSARALERPVAVDRAAAHHALRARLVEAGGAVQRAAVVPHHALPLRPGMGID